jgi:large subunit ribosomal protein L25
MSEAIRLASQKRQAIGRNPVRQLRKTGQVPAVLYGHQQDPLAIAVDGRKLEDAMKHHAHFIELDIEGTIETALLQDLQYDVYGLTILHADFLRVDADEPVDVLVGIETRGHPKGAAEGGILQVFVDEMKLRCSPRNIPDVLVVDVSGLALHDQILLKDVALPQGVTLAADQDPDKALCALVAQKLSAEAIAEEAEGPEVIGAKKEETKES